jgi:dTMP kinase
MKTKGLFICFTGIDGSGKTTLSKGLINDLEINGIKGIYVHSRFSPIILKPFINLGRIFFLRTKDSLRDYRKYSYAKKELLKEYSFLSAIYLRLLLFDYILQIISKVKIPLILGENVICDRYIYDTVITDLAIDLDLSDERIKGLLNTLSHLVPTPDLIFLVDVPEEIAFQRKNDIPSINYLSERKSLYKKLEEDYGMIFLDGSDEKAKLMILIKREVNQYIGCDI